MNRTLAKASHVPPPYLSAVDSSVYEDARLPEPRSGETGNHGGQVTGKGARRIESIRDGPEDRELRWPSGSPRNTSLSQQLVSRLGQVLPLVRLGYDRVRPGGETGVAARKKTKRLVHVWEPLIYTAVGCGVLF